MQPVIHNVIQGPYQQPSQFQGDGITLTLVFDVGTVTLAPDTPVQLKFMNAPAPYDSLTVSGFNNYTIETTGTGYATGSSGTPATGIIKFTGLPLAAPDSGQGVDWYQIVVGTGAAQKTFNMYLTTELLGATPEILNPAYSVQQAGALAIDGLAAFANSGTGKYISALTVNFFDNLDSLDPSLVVKGGNLTAAPKPTAPILGRLSPYNTFTALYDPSNPPSAPTLATSDLIFGWAGAAGGVFEAYTNKIGGDDVAVLTISGTTVSGAVVSTISATVDAEGTWFTSSLHLANGTYTVEMTEHLPGISGAVVGLQSDVQSFTVNGVVVGAGQTSTIAAGHSSDGVTVSSGGTLEVLAGGSAFATAVSTSGTEIVFAGGLDSGASLFGTDASLVLSGGVTSQAVIGSGGTVSVLQDGSAASTSILGAGSSLVSGGTTSGDVLIGSGGNLQAVETVYDGGVASGATLSNTGVLVVSSGGTAVSTIVISTNVGNPGRDGGLIVSSGGTASGAVISSGGLMFERGGVDAGTTISAGGKQFVESGGLALGDSIYDVQLVLSDGVTSGTNVRSGGIEIVSSGGHASATTVQSGGSAVISTGGIASGVTAAGGTASVSSGGIIHGQLTINAGGIGVIGPGGSADGLTANGGGGGVGSAIVSSGGSVGIGGLTVGNGGIAIVLSGGIASGGMTIHSGGIAILSGGQASGNALIQSGGTLELFGDAVLSGGVKAMSWAQSPHVVSYMGNTLIVSAGADTARLQILSVAAQANNFILTSDGHGGTLINFHS